MACGAACSGHFRGRGSVRIAEVGNLNKNYPLGNTSVLSWVINTDEEVIPDYQSESGGVCTVIYSISDITVNLVIDRVRCSDVEALALLAEVTPITAATTVTAEVQTAYHGGLIVFSKMPDPATIVVENSAETTTYTEGTDYLVTGAGIVILSTGTITDEQVLHITYDTVGSDQLMINKVGFQNVAVIFDGVNQADGKKTLAILYNAKFTAAQERTYISDTHATFSLTGRAQKDANGNDIFEEHQV